MKTINDIILESKMRHNAYKGQFWCHERKDFFSWEEFINYEHKE